MGGITTLEDNILPIMFGRGDQSGRGRGKIKRPGRKKTLFEKHAKQQKRRREDLYNFFHAPVATHGISFRRTASGNWPQHPVFILVWGVRKKKEPGERSAAPPCQLERGGGSTLADACYRGDQFGRGGGGNQSEIGCGACGRRRSNHHEHPTLNCESE